MLRHVHSKLMGVGTTVGKGPHKKHIHYKPVNEVMARLQHSKMPSPLTPALEKPTHAIIRQYR